MEILLDLNILFSMMIGGFLEILPDIQTNSDGTGPDSFLHGFGPWSGSCFRETNEYLTNTMCLIYLPLGPHICIVRLGHRCFG